MKYYDDYDQIASRYPSTIRDSILFNDKRLYPVNDLPKEFRYPQTVEPREPFFVRLKAFIRTKLLKR